MNEAFHFLRPLWLLAIPLVYLLIWWYQRSRQHGGVWNQLVDAALQPFVLNASSGTALRGGLVSAIAATVLLIGLAGPAWERAPVPVFRSESALVVALDLSASMNAEDLAPSRLALAKFKVADLLALRKGGQSALIVFAAQSFVVTPLTDDTTTLLGHLRGLDTSIMPSQGSEPATALALAGELLTQAGIIGGHVLLVTDGADATQLAQAKSELEQHDFTLSVLGVGTVAGAPIPDSSGGFAKHSSGEIIMSALASEGLSALAGAGGGLYLPLKTDDSEVTALENFVQASLRDRSKKLDDLAANQWQDAGPWLLLLVLPFAAMGFRRGLLLTLIVSCSGSLLPRHADADWWRTEDQAAASAFEQGEFDQAAERFKRRDWRASARYRSGDYEQAIADFAEGDDAQAHYNRANALARLGRYDEAIAAYDTALERQPGNDDALYNKELLKKLLEEQQPPPQDQGKSDDQQDGDNKKAQDEQQQGEGEQGGGQSSEEAEQELSGGNSQGGSERSDENSEQTGSQTAQQQDAEAEERDANAANEGESESVDSGDIIPNESDLERAQATEQWLRQIPDDPAGLLRRKFQYQYKQHYGKLPYEGNRW